jgi:hypothetical protein
MSTDAPVVGAEDSSIFSSTLRSRGRRIFATLVAVVLAFAVLGQISSQTRGARGPSSSSYATSSGGLAALVSLLNANDIPTARLTTPIDEARSTGKLQTDDLLVVVDQDLSRSETDSLIQFAELGAGIIGGGRASLPWLSRVLSASSLSPNAPDDPLRSERGSDGVVLARLPGADFTLAVRDSAPQVFDKEPSGTTTIGVDDNAMTAIAQVGPVFAVADTTVFANAQLAKLDNAAFALALLRPGGGGRVVSVFVLAVVQASRRSPPRFGPCSLASCSPRSRG